MVSSLDLPRLVCNGPFISPDSNHSSRNSTFSNTTFLEEGMINMAESISCPFADRQGGAKLARLEKL